MGKLLDLIHSSAPLVSDGAWGTAMIERGLHPGECPDLWSIDHYSDVVDIARSYLNAGSQMVETNSFGANSCKLSHFGLSDKAIEINEAAARASKEAAGSNHLVLGSMGPTGKLLLMGEISEDEMFNVFSEQAAALERGGADAICIETMSDLDEASIAVRAAKESTKLDVICTFTFEKTVQGDFRTMMGVDPITAATEIVKIGADITGTNCGNGMERMAEIIKEMNSVVPNTPLLVHANAGLPHFENGKDIYPEAPSQMAEFARLVLENGAQIIGGCCGTTPEHIKAIAEVAKAFK